MSPAKTAAQRQAELKARRLAAGLVRVCVWLHPDDAEELRAAAAKITKRRERQKDKA